MDGFLRIGKIVKTAVDDHRQLRLRLAQLCKQIESVLARHTDIRDQKIRLFLAAEPVGIVAVQRLAHDLDGKADGSQRAFQHDQHEFFVVCNDNSHESASSCSAFFIRSRSALSAPGFCIAAGNSISAVVPTPTSLKILTPYLSP